MTGQQLRNSILQEAIQGRLVSNVLQPGEKTGTELLQAILSERQEKENKEKGKKAKKLTLSIIEEEPWELPEGWCWCKLDDVGVFTRGNGIKKDEVISDGFPCVRYGELYTRYRIQFDSVVSHVNEATYNKSQKIETGDVVMALTGENEYDIALASVYLGDVPVAMGGDMTKLHPFIDSKYLVYCINSPYCIQCKSLLATGQIIVHISNDKLASIAIPLPPLSIQKAIVKKIEDLFPLVDEYDKAAGELETLNKILPEKLRKSVLQEAIHGNLVSNDIPDGEATAPELLQQILKERQDRENREKGKKAKILTLSTIEEEPWNLPEGWCWCKLSDLFSIVSARRVHQSDWRTSGIPFYRTREIGWLSDNRTDVKPELFIDESLYEQFKQSGYPMPGDIMMTAVGTVGKTYIVQPGDKFYYKDASVLCLENFSKVSPKYICYLIASDFFKSMIAEEAMGTTVATITMVRANEYLVPLPPLSIQHRIVEKIEDVFATIDKLNA